MFNRWHTSGWPGEYGEGKMEHTPNPKPCVLCSCVTLNTLWEWAALGRLGATLPTQYYIYQDQISQISVTHPSAFPFYVSTNIFKIYLILLFTCLTV